MADEIVDRLINEKKMGPTDLISVGLNLITFAIGNSDVAAADLREVVDETLTYAFNLRTREDGTS